MVKISRVAQIYGTSLNYGKNHCNQEIDYRHDVLRATNGAHEDMYQNRVKMMPLQMSAKLNK